ncbi:MAG: hypothetical protein H6Q69_225 [Firmicutes bacterium]|nr:hypothetical protein [Bacillota bacterium]
MEKYLTTEPCPHCEAENEESVLFNGSYITTCPSCGEKLRICGECLHYGKGKCDWDEKTGCYRDEDNI